MINHNCLRDVLTEIDKSDKPVTMKLLFKYMEQKYAYPLSELRKAYEFCYMWKYVELLQPSNVMICHKVTGLTRHGKEYLISNTGTI